MWTIISIPTSNGSGNARVLDKEKRSFRSSITVRLRRKQKKKKNLNLMLTLLFCVSTLNLSLRGALTIALCIIGNGFTFTSLMNHKDVHLKQWILFFKSWWRQTKALWKRKHWHSGKQTAFFWWSYRYICTAYWALVAFRFWKSKSSNETLNFTSFFSYFFLGFLSNNCQS